MALSKFNFDAVRKRVLQTNKELPLILANDAKNEFLKNFADQGFGGKGWQEVQRRIPGTGPYKYPKTKDLGRHTRNILQGKGSGRLRKDVANSVDTGTAFPGGYELVVKNEYGIFHNEGEGNLPQRKFVGNTPELLTKLRNRVKTYFNKVWQA